MRRLWLIPLFLALSAEDCSHDADCAQKVTLSLQTGSGMTPTPGTAQAICAASAAGDTKEAVRLVRLVEAGVAGAAVVAFTFQESSPQQPVCLNCGERVSRVDVAKENGARMELRTCDGCGAVQRADRTPMSPAQAARLAGEIEKLQLR